MKLKLLLLSSLLVAFPLLADIEGTTKVNAPIAPPATNSNFAAVDDQFIGGGFRVSFENVGDWNDTALLPTGRMRTNMVVRARTDPQHRSYRLISISPRVFEPDTDVVLKAQVDALEATVNAGGGFGGTSSNSLIIVNNVDTMIALPHSRLTNGPVIVHTLSRTSGGIGGSDFVFDLNSVASTNRGAVFKQVVSGRFTCIGQEPCNVDLYGADSVGTTDSALAFADAGTYGASIKRRVYVPGKTYYFTTWAPPANSNIYLEKGALLRLHSYPTYPGGSTSVFPDLVKPFIKLSDGTTFEANGSTLDGRGSTLTATSWDLATIHIRDASNISVNNVRILNSFAHSICVRYSTNVTFLDPVIEGVGGAFQISKSMDITILQGMSLNQLLGNPYPYTQHLVDQNGNKNVRWDGFVVRNATALAGGSYAFSGFTVGGDIGATFTHMTFEPVGSGTVVNGAAMLLDGCKDTVFTDSDVSGWNVGASTAVEVSSPRNVTLRNLTITGPKRYESFRDDGGAGIFVIDNGIFQEDTGNYKWNQAGWQWRARNSGAGMLIENCKISKCFDGVLFTACYATIRNCTITGNRHYGILVGREGNGGSSSFGWVNGFLHRTVGCTIENNLIAWNGLDGIRLARFDELWITGNQVYNNSQYGTVAAGYDGAGISNEGTTQQGNVYLRDNFFGNRPDMTLVDSISLDPSQPQYVSRSSRVTASGSTTAMVKSTTSMTAREYNRLYLRISTTGETVRIIKLNQYLVNTGSTYSIGATSITLDTGSGPINVGDQITFAGDANVYTVATALNTMTGVVVLQAPGLIQTLANNTAVTHTTKEIQLESTITAPGAGVAFDIIEVPVYKVTAANMEEIMPGQRMVLKGVNNGGLDMSCIVETVAFENPDEFEVMPCGLGGIYGTFVLPGWQDDLGGAIKAGVGTLSYTYYAPPYYNPQAALKVTASVDLSSDMDDPYWIGVDPGTGTYEWRAMRRNLGWGGLHTEMYVDRPFSQSFSGKTFLVSRFNGEFNLGQQYGMYFDSSSAKVNMIGTGNSFGGNDVANILSTGSPDVPYVRITDSTTPTLPLQGDKFQIANGSARTITSMGGGWEGRMVRLVYLSGVAPTFDCTGTTIKSQDGADKTLTVNSVVNCTYVGGNWICTFNMP